MSYTQEEIEKTFKISRELEAEFWGKCAEHVTQAVAGLIGSTYCNKITISGSWQFTIGGFERGFFGDAVVEIDNLLETGFIKTITFHAGNQKKFTYTK